MKELENEMYKSSNETNIELKMVKGAEKKLDGGKIRLLCGEKF